jgi:hypothetical protein
MLTATPPTLVALGTLVVSIVNSIKANQIHVLVNSKMTEALADVADAKREIAALHTTIAAIREGDID